MDGGKDFQPCELLSRDVPLRCGHGTGVQQRRGAARPPRAVTSRRSFRCDRHGAYETWVCQSMAVDRPGWAAAEHPRSRPRIIVRNAVTAGAIRAWGAVDPFVSTQE